jgi:hypothetical protein
MSFLSSSWDSSQFDPYSFEKRPIRKLCTIVPGAFAPVLAKHTKHLSLWTSSQSEWTLELRQLDGHTLQGFVPKKVVPA